MSCAGSRASWRPSGSRYAVVAVDSNSFVMNSLRGRWKSHKDFSALSSFWQLAPWTTRYWKPWHVRQSRFQLQHHVGKLSILHWRGGLRGAGSSRGHGQQHSKHYRGAFDVRVHAMPCHAILVHIFFFACQIGGPSVTVQPARR